MNANTFKTKTFWAALGSVIGAVGSAATGVVSWPDAAQVIVTAVLAACLRDGITTESR